MDDIRLPQHETCRHPAKPLSSRLDQGDRHFPGALKAPGVIGILTGEDVAKMSQPFPVGVTVPAQVLQLRRG